MILEYFWLSQLLGDDDSLHCDFLLPGDLDPDLDLRSESDL